MAFGEVRVNGAQEDLLYQSSFGNMSNRTVYLDLLRNVDKPIDLFGIKSGEPTESKAALQTGSNLYAIGTVYSATTGNIPVLFPTFVDSRLYDLTKRDTPLASGLLPRVTNRGLFADIVKRTVLPTAVFAAEAGTLTSVNSTYTRVAKPMKYAYAVGEVSGPAIVASNAWQNVLQFEVEAAYRSLKELEENTIINGAGSSNDFVGLISSISTNTANKGGDLILSDIDTAFQKIREAKGHPNLIVTDWFTYNRIKQLMRPMLIMQTGSTMNFGFENIVYEGVPIVPDLFMPTTGAARELLVLDTQTENNIQIRVLQDASYVEMGKTADTLKFYIASYYTLLIVNEAWCYRIYNLT